MIRLMTLSVPLLIGLVGSVVGGPGTPGESDNGREAAIEALEKLGGRVRKAVISVYLEGAGVRDGSLAHLKEFPDLRVLRLFRTGVTDAGLAHVESSTNLSTFDFTGELGDAGLAHLGGLRRLRALNLPSSVVSDAGLVHLEGLKDLEHLNLSRSRVTDAGLVHLEGLTRLRTLALYETAVSDAGLTHLEGLKNLELLILKRTDVSAVGVGKLQRVLPDCTIAHSPRT